MNSHSQQADRPRRKAANPHATAVDHCIEAYPHAPKSREADRFRNSSAPENAIRINHLNEVLRISARTHGLRAPGVADDRLQERGVRRSTG